MAKERIQFGTRFLFLAMAGIGLVCGSWRLLPWPLAWLATALILGVIGGRGIGDWRSAAIWGVCSFCSAGALLMAVISSQTFRSMAIPVFGILVVLFWLVTRKRE